MSSRHPSLVSSRQSKATRDLNQLAEGQLASLTNSGDSYRLLGFISNSTKVDKYLGGINDLIKGRFDAPWGH